MTKFSKPFLAALLLISLSPPAIAMDAMERFITLNSACQAASDAVWQMHLPRIQQAIKAGDEQSAHLTCEAFRQANQACEDATRSLSGLPPLPPQLVEVARMQARAAMLAHGMTPCN